MSIASAPIFKRENSMEKRHSCDSLVDNNLRKKLEAERIDAGGKRRKHDLLAQIHQ